MNILLRDIMLFLPEIFLALGAMLFLMVGVFQERENFRVISRMSLFLVFVVFGLLFLLPDGRIEIFGGSFVIDNFAKFMKMLVVGTAIAVMFVSNAFAELEKIDRFEYPILILMSIIGVFLMISSHDLIALYIGIEMQSLALYILATWHRDSLQSSEAGLKYFVLGALSSGILLYGCGLLYGFGGTLSFSELAHVPASPGLVIGFVFVLAGLAFKISAVPFHMWAPDIYEGAPTPVTFFLATVAKIAGIALICRFVLEAVPPHSQIEDVLYVLSAASMILGAVAAIGQQNLKRLLAYSSIGHMGYALIGLVVLGETGLQSVIIYMTIYVVTLIGIFGCLLALRSGPVSVRRIGDLAGLSETQPVIACLLLILLFSLAGIPPLAGFFAKFYIFLAAIENGYVLLAVIGVLSSVVASFYYLRIIKLIYFDSAEETLDVKMTPEARAILLLSGVFSVGFILAPRLVSEPARWAAAFFAGGG